MDDRSSNQDNQRYTTDGTTENAPTQVVTDDVPQYSVVTTQALPRRPNFVVIGIAAALIALAAWLVLSMVHKSINNGLNNSASAAIVSSPQVSIGATGFVPATISISVGQSVTWKNSDVNMKLHSVVSDPYPTDNQLPGLNSNGNIMPGNTYSYVFTTAGTYTYHDGLNPSIKGTVIVKNL